MYTIEQTKTKQPDGHPPEQPRARRGRLKAGLHQGVAAALLHVRAQSTSILNRETAGADGLCIYIFK